MIKFKALNQESSEESEEEEIPSVTKEAQEQTAFADYNHALELLRENKLEEASKVLEDLLKSNFLAEVTKPIVTEALSQPAPILKYSCHMNMAAVLEKLGDLSRCVDHYLEAAELDSTDVTLWYRLGTVSLKTVDYELACDAFLQGLRCSKRHWPCLDEVITLLYVLNDYVSCLCYVARALEADPAFVKGLAIRDQILKEQPSILEAFNLLYRGNLLLDIKDYDATHARTVLEEAWAMREKKRKRWQEEAVSPAHKELPLVQPVVRPTWLSLGESLLEQHHYIRTAEQQVSYCWPLQLTLANTQPVAEAAPIDETEDKEPSTEGDEDGTGRSAAVSTCEGATEGDDHKAKKRRRNSLSFIEQWMWGGQRRSARVRSTVRREAERDDGNLSQALRKLVPANLLPSGPKEDRQKASDALKYSEDSLDTMELYHMFSRRESTEEKKADQMEAVGSESTSQAILQEGYFYTKDVKPDQSKHSCASSTTEGAENKTASSSPEKTEEKGGGCSPSEGMSVCSNADAVSKRTAKNVGGEAVGNAGINVKTEPLEIEDSDNFISNVVKLAESGDAEVHEVVNTVVCSDKMLAALEDSFLADMTKKERAEQGTDVQLVVCVDGESECMDVSSPREDVIIVACDSVQTDLEPKVAESAMEAADALGTYRGPSTKDVEHAESKQNVGRVIEDILDKVAISTCKEMVEVEQFMKENNGKDMVDVLLEFVTSLSRKWMLTWPPGLARVFIEAYECMRLHVPYPSALCPAEEPSTVRVNIDMMLLYAELCVERLFEQRVTSSEANNSKTATLGEALGQLDLLSSHPAWLGDHCSFFTVRLHWLKIHLLINQGNVDSAIQLVYGLLSHLENRSVHVTLPNCRHHSVIRWDSACKLLTSLLRSQNLAEVQNLYEQQNYEELAEVLQETFRYSQQQQLMAPAAGIAPVDRATQLAMLLDALWQLRRYRDCFYWGEASCHEALHKYLSCEESEQSKWATAIEKLLSALESCINKGGLSVVSSLSSARLSRLVQNLTHMLCHQLDAPETAVEMPIESVTPWILLQQVLQWQDERDKSRQSNEDNDQVPGHIQIMFTAHEHLARRSWCCSNEGALLLHTLDVVMPRLRDASLLLFRDRLNQGLEQALYCLYAHPSKRCKGRYLQDHGVPQISLSWERAQQLYQFYRPAELPEFDSYRVGTISADVEVLLRRIVALIPPYCVPAHLLDKMTSYVDGDIEELPVLGPQCQLPHSMAAIYYLLADYYFKNNEWAKAIRHYLLDVCVNPVRLDSWAGMALAKGSQLEMQLNSCEPLRSETEFLKHASSAQICFRRALEIDPSHSLLWIEYGSFVYMVHSFCSRLLKQESSISMEMFNILDKQKEEMLDLAVECFSRANKVWYTIGEEQGLQDERWLHHYMLGKVAEKRDHHPDACLKEYIQASRFLTENKASYGRKISYNQPANLAVEALEVNYRIHARILKYLEQNEGKSIPRDVQALFVQYLDDAEKGPFLSSLREADRPTEAAEDRRKRPAPDSLAQQVESKRPRVKAQSPTVDMAVMEDVMDLMEDLVSKVCESESDDVMEIVMISSSESECDPLEITPPTIYLDEDEEPAVTEQNVEGKVLGVDEPIPVNIEMITCSKPLVPHLALELELEAENTDKSGPAARRSSQDSTTTTATATSTSSQSSSSSSDDELSSGDDSSDSSSSSDSSDSESDDADKTGETVVEVKTQKTSSSKENVCEEKDEQDEDTNKDHYALIARCLAVLEECVVRFPQHYKSVYRLTHYYFYSKFHRDVAKCRELLLGTYRCQPFFGRPPGTTFQGLFADRKNNNFFNGVWRIPSSEIDRPGSFASHMSRCISLLMDVLREQKDHRLLLELCLQLRRTPDIDKKYLRDGEREQLSRQALSLCLQALRSKVCQKGEGVVLEVYRAYQSAQRHLPHKEAAFAALLIDSYKQHFQKDAGLDQVVKFCQNKILANRAARAPPPTTTTQPSTKVAVSSPTVQQKKSGAASSQPGRSRGRPPRSDTTGMLDLLGKSLSPSSKVPTLPLGLPSVPYYLPSLVDQRLAAYNYLQAQSYQAEFLRHFAAGASMTSLLTQQLAQAQAQAGFSSTSVPKTSKYSPSMAKSSSVVPKLPKTSAVAISTISQDVLKDIPNISITPVGPTTSGASLLTKTSSKQQQPTLQQKLQATSQAFSKTLSKIPDSISVQAHPAGPRQPARPSKEQAYASLTTKPTPFSSPLKDGMLSGSVSISQVPAKSSTRSEVPTSRTQLESKGKANSSVSSEDHAASSTSLFKNQNSLPSGTSILKTQKPNALMNIGHEITVTPSIPQGSSKINQLQQQNVKSKAKCPPDFSMSIPSAISIMPKQQQKGMMDSGGGAFRRSDSVQSSSKPKKDSVAIVELSRGKLPAIPAKRALPTNKVKPVADSEPGAEVEIITLD